MSTFSSLFLPRLVSSSQGIVAHSTITSEGWSCLKLCMQSCVHICYISRFRLSYIAYIVQFCHSVAGILTVYCTCVNLPSNTFLWTPLHGSLQPYCCHFTWSLQLSSWDWQFYTFGEQLLKGKLLNFCGSNIAYLFYVW